MYELTEEQKDLFKRATDRYEKEWLPLVPLIIKLNTAISISPEARREAIDLQLEARKREIKKEHEEAKKKYNIEETRPDVWFNSKKGDDNA
jgi:hypothetical protein